MLSTIVPSTSKIKKENCALLRFIIMAAMCSRPNEFYLWVLKGADALVVSGEMEIIQIKNFRFKCLNRCEIAKSSEQFLQVIDT